MFSKHISKKEKIILKIYIRYIMKKILHVKQQKQIGTNSLLKSFKRFKFFNICSNKFFLENIINQKHISYNYNLEYSKYSI
jgi:hypothetical protein